MRILERRPGRRLGVRAWRSRVNKDYDIRLDNDSDQWIRMDTTNIYNYITWTRNSDPDNGTYEVSAYTYPSTIWIAPRVQDKVFSADNASHWIREDGVADSDPSPYGSPVAKSSDPSLDGAWTAHASQGSVAINGGFSGVMVTVDRPSI